VLVRTRPVLVRAAEFAGIMAGNGAKNTIHEMGSVVLTITGGPRRILYNQAEEPDDDA
jgi:hypothetical protein